MGKTETWKDVQVKARRSRRSYHVRWKTWNESCVCVSIEPSVEQFGRSPKEIQMTKVWRQSFANRFKTIT